jgi:5-methylcytosine-specific restriction endonuclease McrA
VQWKRRRQHQLRIQPLCAICLKRGVVVPATVADHVAPHNGNWNAFRLGELQSLCVHCHNGVKRAIERGFEPRPKIKYGVDGWPV